jgi:hypothetical protein
VTEESIYHDVFCAGYDVWVIESHICLDVMLAHEFGDFSCLLVFHQFGAGPNIGLEIVSSHICKWLPLKHVLELSVIYATAIATSVTKMPNKSSRTLIHVSFFFNFMHSFIRVWQIPG